ncbi:MAG: acyl carrier protein [Clostridiaceae bacterium]|nr:acyl carrier protein [Clostridiaceae bacterium]NLZ69820.1 acyl carrier protein [Clostridiaceae bacterium]
MTKETILENVRNILVEQLGVDPENVTMDSDFIDDLNADSLDIVDLVMLMEEEFGISIPDDEAENIHTVGDAVNYIASTKSGN